jgi:transposase
VELDPRDLRIAELERLLSAALALIDAQAERIAEQDARIAELDRSNAELKARLGMNSTNSSKPPSSDGPGVQRPAHKPTGRKRGGQPGHKGHERCLVPPERVSRVVDCKSDRCRRCGRSLSPDPQPRRYQVVEMPEIQPDVSEYRQHVQVCACGQEHCGEVPCDVLLHGFGPRMAAYAALLTARFRLSKREAAQMLELLFGITLSAASVCALEREVSAALEQPDAQARALVREQPFAHADETGWRLEKMRAWLWVAVTSVVTVFRVATSRGSAIAQEILGRDFAGILVSDRWSGYRWVDPHRRQLCWAHLLRDVLGMIDRGGVGGAVATKMLAEIRRTFRWWHRIRDGTLSREQFQRRMKPARARFEALLAEAHRSAEKKTAGMCGQILDLAPALWTFVDVEGIEPTNNIAERAGRHAVLWRKGCFGSDSERGARFVERILTVNATLRQHGRNPLAFLFEAVCARRSGRPAPALIPTPSALAA